MLGLKGLNWPCWKQIPWAKLQLILYLFVAHASIFLDVTLEAAQVIFQYTSNIILINFRN